VSLSLGLDVGGTTMKVAVLDGEKTVHEESIPVPSRDVLAFVRLNMVRLIDHFGAWSVGVGLAGLVSHPDGQFVWGPHLEGLAVPYRSVLSDAVGFDVLVDNDANLAAYGEWAIGAGEQADPLLMVALGTGIGVGLVSGGHIYRGASFAGEAGHMRMRDGGDPCSCGRSGCWESLVSGYRMDRAASALAASDPDGAVARLAGGSAASGVHLAKAVAAGDAVAIGAVEEMGRWLGEGLVNLVLMCDPARIVVGGAAVGTGETLLRPARAVLAEFLPGSSFRPAVPVVGAGLGAFSGAVGAALAGRQVHNDAHDR
jgi:glucokinase